ncbi:MAG: glycerate kinase, partial [Acidimicrobiia bacterium]|nr:glycerate kinase [Acidimicrobiia bacterium]
MIRVLVAPDSLKGSLSAAAVAAAIAAGVRRADPFAEVIERPMADGGEGALAILLEVWGGESVAVATVDPLGRPMEATYGRVNAAGVGGSGGTAVVEFAAAGGLPLVGDAPDPVAADSWGTGLLLRHALEHGAEKLVVCLGGSASTDGGAGILRALGVRLLDAAGAELAPGGGTLVDLDRVDLGGLMDAARRARWTLACDVTNP